MNGPGAGPEPAASGHGAHVWDPSGGRSPLAAPFAIGPLTIPNRVVLAPMAGLTTGAYRRHLRTHGAGMVTSEMVSAHGLLHHNARTTEYLRFSEEERPLAVQLFGESAEVLGRAAESVLSRPHVPDVIDINMGCPVRKVVRTGAGAALMGDPARAAAVAAAVVAAAGGTVPVTVKLRSGLREGERTAVELARRLEAVGVAAVAVHPRAATQFYRGRADHSVTAEVAAAVAIPVIASGDVTSAAAAMAVVEAAGAAAVMAARGAAGDPWLLRALLEGRDQARPPLPEVVADLRALLALVVAEMGSLRAARWMRKLLGWYLRPSGVPAAAIETLRRLPDATALDEALSKLAGAE